MPLAVAAGCDDNANASPPAASISATDVASPAARRLVRTARPPLGSGPGGLSAERGPMDSTSGAEEAAAGESTSRTARCGAVGASSSSGPSGGDDPGRSSSGGGGGGCAAVGTCRANDIDRGCCCGADCIPLVPGTRRGSDARTAGCGAVGASSSSGTSCSDDPGRTGGTGGGAGGTGGGSGGGALAPRGDDTGRGRCGGAAPAPGTRRGNAGSRLSSPICTDPPGPRAQDDAILEGQRSTRWATYQLK